jgi:hypothetical protein
LFLRVLISQIIAFLVIGIFNGYLISISTHVNYSFEEATIAEFFLYCLPSIPAMIAFYIWSINKRTKKCFVLKEALKKAGIYYFVNGAIASIIIVQITKPIYTLNNFVAHSYSIILGGLICAYFCWLAARLMTPKNYNVPQATIFGKTFLQAYQELMVYLPKSLKGCLETLILMASTKDCFSDDKEAAMRSFILPVFALITVVFMTTEIVGPPTFATTAYVIHIILGLIFITIKYIIFLFLSYFIAGLADQKENFARFVHANNWLSIIATIILTPSLLMIYNGQEIQDVFPYLMCSVFYIYLMLSVLTRNVLRVSWVQSYLVSLSSLIANAFVSAISGQVLAGMPVF